MSNSGIGIAVACLVLVVSIGFYEVNSNLQTQNSEICQSSPACSSSSSESSVQSSVSSSISSASEQAYCDSLNSQITEHNTTAALEVVASTCPGPSVPNLLAALFPVALAVMGGGYILNLIREKRENP